MEKSSKKGSLVVLTKGTWQMKTSNNYTFRDNSAMGTINIQAMTLEKESLVPIDKLTLDIFPGEPSSSAQSIHVPDYLGAVTGNRFCFVYSPQKAKRLFLLYEIDEAGKKLSVKSQFELDDKLSPTAIIAIEDKVFLGFPGQVGLVDLTQPKLSLNLFHTWEEQTWGKSTLKTIDAFAFDSAASKSELIAIDDVVWPKYAFTYKLSEKDVPKNTGKFDLPSGPNEQYKDAVKTGDRVVLTAKYGHRGGQGNTIVVLEGSETVWSISEHAPWDGEEGRELFVGDKFTPHSSLGLLDKNVVLVTAGKRGVIAIPIDQIKREKKKMYGQMYDVSVPHGVKNLHVGTTAEHLRTVKEKSTALILGTTDKDSVLSEVKWNKKSNDLEVTRSHNVQGLYEQFFIEN